MRKIVSILANPVWFAAHFALLLTATLQADEIKRANACFEAKEYDCAYELYSSLPATALRSWQKARLHYNLGTILLAKGDAAGAEGQFSQITQAAEGMPYLDLALQTNRAILHFRSALSALSGKETPVEDYSRAFFHLRSALAAVSQAQRADCRLQLFKGDSVCKREDSLRVLQKAVKNQLAIALGKYGGSKIADLPLTEGIPYLIFGTNIAESHLDFLGSIPLENPLKEKYQKLFAKDLKSWEIVWNSQEKKLAALQEAREDFAEGVQLMEEEKLEKSRTAFLRAETKLSEIIHKLWGEDPFKDLVRKLLSAYQYVLDQASAQPASFYQLVLEQKKVGEVVEDGSLPLEFFTFSSQQLQTSLEYARMGKPVLSRYYLLEARQWIRRFLRAESQQPEEILEGAIQDQEHALTLNHLFNQLDKEGENPASLLLEAQDFTLKTAAPFIKAVLEKESREWPDRCQCMPWNLTIPLFVKGEEAAHLAEEFLKRDPDHPEAMRKQEEAVKYWKQALNNMLHPEDERKEQEEPAEPPPPSEEAKEEKQSFEEVMRQLQQMHRDDRQTRPGTKQPQKGMRPW